MDVDTSDNQSNLDVDTTNIYGPETIISYHTNKPVDETNSGDQPPIFWCGVCHMRLKSPIGAAQHMNGRAHAVKVNSPKSLEEDGGVLNNGLKRKLDDTSNVKVENSVEGSSSKKSKQQSHNVHETATAKEIEESEIKCEICKMQFKTCLQAVHHFKGKKHTSKVELDFKRKHKVQEPADGDLKCEECDKEFVSALLAVQHFKGKKHATKLHLIAKEKKGVEQGLDPCLLKCEVCDKVFTSSLIALQHFQSKKHASRVEVVSKKNVTSSLQSVEGEKNTSNVGPVSKKKKEAEKTAEKSLRCEDCDKTFNSDALAVSHYKGKKHATKVASKFLQNKAQRGRGGQRGGQRGSGWRGGWSGGFGRGYGSFQEPIGTGFQGGSPAGLWKDYGSNYSSDSGNWYQNYNNKNTPMRLVDYGSNSKAF